MSYELTPFEVPNRLEPTAFKADQHVFPTKQSPSFVSSHHLRNSWCPNQDTSLADFYRLHEWSTRPVCILTHG